MAAPTYEELLAFVAVQAAEIERLTARVAELEARLAANSRNSSKPPSTDGPAKPAPTPLQRRSERKAGGQGGHPGRTLCQVDDPDQVVRHEPACCAGCGSGLGRTAVAGVVRRQGFDLPPVRVRVVEHQLVAKLCRCGVLTRPEAPDGVAAPVQYGPVLTTVIIYLYVGQLLSKQRTAAALADLFGVPIGSATVEAATRRAAGPLPGFLDRVRARIAAAPVAHFDETASGSPAGSAGSTPRPPAAIRCFPRTAAAASKRWTPPACCPTSPAPPYTTPGPPTTPTGRPPTRCATPTCSANYKPSSTQPARPPAVSPAGAGPARSPTACSPSEAAHPTGDTLDPTVLADATRQIRHAATGAAADHTTIGKPADKHRALARRIHDRRADYLRFTTNPAVPFDNNPAEREIRLVKTRQKISGCARTMTGAEHFCAIRSYTATTRKHGINLIDALTQLAQEKPWLPPTT